MNQYLIVELGNPTEEYRGTRHNIGFRMVSHLADKQGWTWSTARYGEVTSGRIKNVQLTLLKPSTYMNLSGTAVRYWMRELKVPVDHILICLDDLALPFGTLRMKPGGSAGGHNGLKHITELLGTDRYPRLRFGIGHDYPEAYSDEMGQIAQGVTYGKLLQILSPVEGFPLEISDTRSFTHQTKPLEIPGYEPNKYRLVAIVHSSEDPHLYARTVLESYSIPLDLKHVSIRSVDPILSSAPQLILDSEGRICSNSPEWSVVDLYTLDGASLTSDSILPAGCYIVSLHHTNGATIYLKYIINK